MLPHARLPPLLRELSASSASAFSASTQAERGPGGGPGG